MTPTGFWTNDLEGTTLRMNQCLLQFDTAANRPASSAATKGMLYVATDTLVVSYDNGSTWVEMARDIGARVYDASGQSIANATHTKVNFDREDYDTDNIHDKVTNNTRLTCKTAGKYLIFASNQWGTNSTGERLLELFLNNTTPICRQGMRADAGAGGSVSLSLATVFDLAVNDYLEIRVYQNSGGSLIINPGTSVSPVLGMQLVGT